MHSRNALQLGLHDIYYKLEKRYITHVQGCGIYSDLHTTGNGMKVIRHNNNNHPTIQQVRSGNCAWNVSRVYY